MKTIDSVYVFVADNDATKTSPAEEGVVGMFDNETGALQPLFCTDPRLLNPLRQAAKQIANVTGKKFKVLKFSAREEIGTVG